MTARRSLVDPLASPAIRELTGDPALLDAMIEAELALTAALAAEGVVDADLSAQSSELRTALGEQLDAIAEEARAGGNPVIPLVARLRATVEDLVPGAGESIHLGATSQDVLDTAVMRRGAAVLERLIELLVDLGDALAALSVEHRATAMVGRTLGQHAAPTVFGAVAAGRLGAVTSALGAARRTRAMLPAQLGGAVGTLSTLVTVIGERTGRDESVSRTLRVVDDYSRRLGLRTPAAVWHTDRTPIVELASALGLAAGAAGAFALDVTMLSRTEVGELAESLGAGQGTSSAMPHKHNPVGAVLVVAAARQTPALVGSLFTALASEDQRPSGAWHAEWRPLQQLEELALGAVEGAAALAATLEVRAEAMRARLDSSDGSVFSEDVAAWLGERIGRARAFALLTETARESAATGRPLRVVLEGRLASSGSPIAADDALHERLARAFEPSPSPGVSGAWIDAAVARYRAVRDTAAQEPGR